MADREGSIYYQSIQDFDFDRACTFLAEKKISFFNKHNNGNILALNDVGDDYEISYEQVKQEALSGKTFNVNIWLNERRKLFWTFRSQDGYFVFDFYLGFLSQEDRDKASKAFFDFFQSEICSKPQSLLGMFIDKNGRTHDYDFAPVFLTDSEEVDYVTDLICLPKEKFGLVAMESDFGMKELDNSFVCASRSSDFLDYLLN